MSGTCEDRISDQTSDRSDRGGGVPTTALELNPLHDGARAALCCSDPRAAKAPSPASRSGNEIGPTSTTDRISDRDRHRMERSVSIR
eukprot:7446611-Alexandrium_andersonii.AAC.1